MKTRAGKVKGGKWHFLEEELACHHAVDLDVDEEQVIDTERWKEQAVGGGSKVTEDEFLAAVDEEFTYIDNASGPYAHPRFWCRRCRRNFPR